MKQDDVREKIKTIIATLAVLVVVACFFVREYVDEHVIDHNSDKGYHFVKTHDYILGTRDDHILLFRRTEDLGWEK